ncbi:hypothetical protein PS1_007670 [Malus domestica]
MAAIAHLSPKLDHHSFSHQPLDDKRDVSKTESLIHRKGSSIKATNPKLCGSFDDKQMECLTPMTTSPPENHSRCRLVLPPDLKKKLGPQAMVIWRTPIPWSRKVS